MSHTVCVEITSVHRQGWLCHSYNHRLLCIDILPLLWLVSCLLCMSYDSVYTGCDCPNAHTIGFVMSHVFPVCHTIKFSTLSVICFKLGNGDTSTCDIVYM